MTPPSPPMMTVFASMHLPLLDQAKESHLAKYSKDFLQTHLHTDDPDWQARLMAELSQSSLWGERSMVVLHTDAAALKNWDKAWWDRWLQSSSKHRVLVLLLGAYTQKQSIFQDPKIVCHNLYESKEGLSARDRAYLSHDEEAVMLLAHLKRTHPKAYAQWQDVAESLTPEARSRWLHSQHSAEPIWLLLWIEILNNQQPLSRMQSLKSSEMIECFNLISHWIRQALLNDEAQKPHDAGFMRWPLVKQTWINWRQHTTLEERYLWYGDWLAQEAVLKGLMHPLDQHQGWQRCLLLTQRWKAKMHPNL